MQSRESIQSEWYLDYYARVGADRNSLRHNPGVMFQVLGLERSFISAIRKVEHDPKLAKVLDVGCGSGGDIYQLLRVSYLPENMSGIDVQRDRLDGAAATYRSISFINGDAAKISSADSSYDLVFESTMFATLPDQKVSEAIASEMIRVCSPNGYLLLLDWRIPKPGAPNYSALTKQRLEKMFYLGQRTELVGVYPGALVPPVGRFLSAYLPSMYFLVAALFPFLVGQVAYLLRKKA